MIKVYHAKNPTFGLTEQSFPQDYELVAYVMTENLNVAFEKTNHISQAWWENAGVRCMKEARSTSMGDVMEADGRLFRCEAVGWKEISLSGR